MSATRYRTVARNAVAEVEVKRSRFRCELMRVEGEAEARAAVERARKTHWDARHHCSAFVIGPGAEIQRSSDDGEPAGTAGMPMLEVLRGAGLSDVVAVVTRWFGGVLLGTGGLVRAYGDAVRAGVEAAGVLERELRQQVGVLVDHGAAGRLEHELRARGVLVTGTSYGSMADIEVTVAPGGVAQLEALVGELTSGVGLVQPGGASWVDLT